MEARHRRIWTAIVAVPVLGAFWWLHRSVDTIKQTYVDRCGADESCRAETAANFERCMSELDPNQKTSWKMALIISDSYQSRVRVCMGTRAPSANAPR